MSAVRWKHSNMRPTRTGQRYMLVGDATVIAAYVAATAEPIVLNASCFAMEQRRFSMGAFNNTYCRLIASIYSISRTCCNNHDPSSSPSRNSTRSKVTGKVSGDCRAASPNARSATPFYMTAVPMATTLIDAIGQQLAPEAAGIIHCARC